MTSNNSKELKSKIRDHRREIPAKRLAKDNSGNYVIIGVSIFLFALFLFGFFPRLFQVRKLEGDAAKRVLPQVSVVDAKADKKPIELTLPSSTAAYHVTPIWARANGYLGKLLVDIGDVVKEGQLLAVLETPDVDQQYDQAVADLASAESKRDIAKISKDRWQSLHTIDPGAISQQEVDDRVATYLTAEADVQAADANMRRYKQLQEFKYIIAPFNGTIIERDVDIGSLITAGSNGSPQRLFVIAETDTIRLFVNVPQCYFRSIQEGVEGTARIREFQGRAFTGTVVRYAKALDPTSRTLLTELHIDNKNGELLSGLYAEVSFILKPDQPYFVVPVAAIIIRAGEPQVAVLDKKDVVHLKTVKIGLDYGKAMQIVDGVNENDRIVTNPSEKIIEGAQVQLLT
ncbi:MAG: hypothetical protein JWO53_866 [Chlamydiia bacterium]|nr:hypothetical protein [Chlamydiia bacterium]